MRWQASSLQPEQGRHLPMIVVFALSLCHHFYLSYAITTPKYEGKKYQIGQIFHK
jgi:hypothetical protein